jgi:hypothetical protein
VPLTGLSFGVRSGVSFIFNLLLGSKLSSGSFSCPKATAALPAIKSLRFIELLLSVSRAAQLPPMPGPMDQANANLRFCKW